MRRGENAGNTLRHDFVVRRLIGPLEPDKAGRVSLRHQLTVAPEAGSDRLGAGAPG